jgi:hypothetical protein
MGRYFGPKAPLTFEQPNIVCLVRIYLKMHKLLYLSRAYDRLAAKSATIVEEDIHACVVPGITAFHSYAVPQFW